MKKTIIFFISIILSCVCLWGQQTIYVIDNVTVENFDGSQLKGRTIKDYQITTTGKGNKAITVHSITTTPSVFSITGDFPKYYYSNGRVIDLVSIPDSLIVNSDIARMKADSITNVGLKILRTRELYGNKRLFVIDGEVTEDESALRSLHSDRIRNVKVLTDKSVRDKLGVAYLIIIETKDKPRTDINEILKKLPNNL